MGIMPRLHMTAGRVGLMASAAIAAIGLRKRPAAGFTIVELLIVIVVIAILAAISTVAYAGIKERASASAVASEVNQWKKLFVAYKTVNGSYPSPVASGDPLTSGGPGSLALNYYCLGTGFPLSSGSPYCYQPGSWRADESTGAYLMSQLSTVGTPPTDTPKYIYGNFGNVGPVLIYLSANNMQLLTVFPHGTSCASLGMQTGASNGNRQNCYYVLN